MSRGLRILLFAIVVIAGPNVFAADAEGPSATTPATVVQPRVAVLPLYAEDERTSRLAANMLTSILNEETRLAVLERVNIDQCIQELKFSQTDLVDPAKAARLGHCLGADMIVTGSIVRYAGGSFEVDVRFVRVESTEVLAAGGASCPESALREGLRRATRRVIERSPTLLEHLRPENEAGRGSVDLSDLLIRKTSNEKPGGYFGPLHEGWWRILQRATSADVVACIGFFQGGRSDPVGQGNLVASLLSLHFNQIDLSYEVPVSRLDDVSEDAGFSISYRSNPEPKRWCSYMRIGSATRKQLRHIETRYRFDDVVDSSDVNFIGLGVCLLDLSSHWSVLGLTAEVRYNFWRADVHNGGVSRKQNLDYPELRLGLAFTF